MSPADEVRSSIQKVYLAQESRQEPFVQQVLERLHDVEIQEFSSQESLSEIHNEINSELDPYHIGKKILILRPTKGGFFNQCPGTQGLLCCNYFVINPVVGCNFDCQYCFLQGYLESPAIQITTNLDDHLKELAQWLNNKRLGFYRIGSGELSDSLSLDPVLQIAPRLIRTLGPLANTQLELKSKSHYVDHLMDLPDKGNTIISFSVNPESIIQEIELGATTLEERLKAAARAADAGYQLAFHFDPIILITNWQKEYSQVVKKIFSSVPADNIMYISLGVMRYFRALRREMRRRFPDSPIHQGPFVEGEDGKWRYFRPKREEVFSFVKNEILAQDPRQWIYFCMEGRNTWKNVFNLDIDNRSNLDPFFRARRRGNTQTLYPKS